MKVFAQKQPLSIVAPTHYTETESQPKNPKIRPSFHGWVTSRVSVRRRSLAKFPAIYRMPSLSAQDVTRVNQATIREGESHRVWPPSVIQSFHRADVITDTKVQHYELRDSSL